MAYKIADVRQGAFERFIGDDMLRHFKAGANAAWSERWTDQYGYHNLEAAERHYESKHGAAAADAFTAGWSWSASN